MASRAKSPAPAKRGKIPPGPGEKPDWQRFAGLWFFLLHAAWWCALHWPLFTGQMWAGGDTLHTFWPYQEFARQSFLKGQIPWWNPYLFQGTAFFAELQSSLFYFPRWLLLPLPTHFSLGASLLFHGAWLSTGLSVFLFRRGADFWSAAFGGAAALVAGFWAGHQYAGHINFFEAGAWIGWLLVCWDIWLEKRQPRHLALWAACLALSFLAGHPQITFYASVFWGAVVIMDLLSSRVWLADAVKFSLIALLLAGALMAFQMFPVLEAARLSTRTAAGAAYAETLSLPPVALLSLGAPFALGAAPADIHLLGGNSWEMFVSFSLCGWLALALGLRAAAGPGRAPWPWLLLAAFCLALSLGTRTPLYALLLKAAPGLSFLRGPARFVLPATLALALGAGLAMGQVRPTHGRWWGLLGGLLLLIGGVVLALSLGTQPHGPLMALLKRAASAMPQSAGGAAPLPRLWTLLHLNARWAVAAGGGLLLSAWLVRIGQPVGLAFFVALMAESAALFLPFNHTAPPAAFDYTKAPTTAMETVTGLSDRPNMDDFLRLGHPTPEGFDPVIPESYRRALNHLLTTPIPATTNGVDFKTWEDPALDLLGVKWVWRTAAGANAHPPAGKWLANEGAFPRLWTLAKRPAESELAKRPPAELVRRLRPDGAGEVSGKWNGPNGFDLLVMCPPRPCALMSTFGWGPGWRVWVDGKEQAAARLPLLLGHFFSLDLPGGTHQVRARYAPTRLGLLGPLALAAWLLVALLAAGVSLPALKKQPD